jgi:hypothetical protein
LTVQRLVLAVCAAGAVGILPALAVESFVGRWAIDPVACTAFGDTAATAPLIATDSNLRWFPGTCRIAKMYKLGETVYIQARCWGESASEIPITLNPRGDRMRVTWNGGKTEEMRRCK